MGAWEKAVKETHLCSFLGKSKEAEIKRINKELANIRSKFKGECAGALLGMPLRIHGGGLSLHYCLLFVFTSNQSEGCSAVTLML